MPLPPDPLADGLATHARRLRAGDTSAERCVAAYLERIDALDGTLRAYWHVAAEAALAQARQLDHRLAAGHDPGPLAGVPVAVKDMIVVEGMPTTFGTAVADPGGPTVAGRFIRRLADCGAIVLGKVATSELALGSAGVHYRRGTPRNPWDAAKPRVPGGSSSGSAVAMAAGLCGLAVGTDTGGSVRTPAAFCGVFGLKASASAWPLDGVMPMAPSLDSLGLLTRSATDAAWAWAALAGASVVSPAAVSGLRLALPRGAWQGLAPAVAAALEAALEGLRRAGAVLLITDLPDADECQALFGTISGAELVAVHGERRLRLWLPHLNPDVALRVEQALRVSPVQREQAMARMRLLRRRADEGFQGFEAWLAPTKAHQAPVFPSSYDAVTDAAMAACCLGPTRAANVLGLCAASLPVPLVSGPRLPVGLQLIGPRHGDARLLALARGLEQVLGPPAAVPDLGAFSRSSGGSHAFASSPP